MKNQIPVYLLLVIFVLIISSLIGFRGEIVGADSRLNSNLNAPQLIATQSINATATFGAGQFKIQLTAIAAQEKP